MTYLKSFFALVALVGLVACETPQTYPVSGQECGPEDPVLDLNVENCAPAV